MIQSAYRDPEVIRQRWLALAFLGGLGSVLGLVALGVASSHGGSAGFASIAGSAALLGSLALSILGALGWARAKRREERERERAADDADD